MNLAAQTVDVWNFLEVEVFYPVLDVGGSPEGKNDGVSAGRVADVSRSLGEVINHVTDISQHLGACALAVPLINAWSLAICQRCEHHDFLGFLHVVRLQLSSLH